MKNSRTILITATLGSALALSSRALAADVGDTTLAGWTFSQFLSEGFPAVDGDTGEAVSFIAATYRGSFVPESSTVDGTLTSAAEAPGFKDTTFGSWSFANFDVNNAIDVRADTFGALNTTNSTTLDGKNMHLTDGAGMMLTFTTTNTLWSITADTVGFGQASAADFTYAARGNGGSATIEWLFNGQVFDTETVSPGAFAVYSAELPPAFYGVGTIEGRLTAGSVSFDNVQINGAASAIPEASSFAGLAGLAGLAFAASRRRRA